VHHAERVAAAVHQFVSCRIANRADAADISQDARSIGCANLSTFAGDDIDGFLLAIAQRLIAEYEQRREEANFVTIDTVSTTTLKQSCRSRWRVSLRNAISLFA
jgi:DNA-directed RNA polymerase specialized sigma24 family protein